MHVGTVAWWISGLPSARTTISRGGGGGGSFATPVHRPGKIVETLVAPVPTDSKIPTDSPSTTQQIRLEGVQVGVDKSPLLPPNRFESADLGRGASYPASPKEAHSLYNTLQKLD